MCFGLAFCVEIMPPVAAAATVWTAFGIGLRFGVAAGYGIGFHFIYVVVFKCWFIFFCCFRYVILYVFMFFSG